MTDAVETETVLVQPSLEDLIADAEEAKDAALQAQITYEEKLDAIVAVYGNTYEFDGQWYQVRSRNSENEGRRITYLCKLRDKPSTWLRGPKAKKKEAEATVDTSPTVTDPKDMVTENTENVFSGTTSEPETTSEQTYAHSALDTLPQEDSTTVID